MSASEPHDFDQPGSFYLGRAYDSDAGEVTEAAILYDSKDLCTHAVCVGMTGSGKTGLCISLIEEAALDGVPVIAIDVKGDMGNLALHFPNLAPSDFEPWVDPGEAAREGRTLQEHAQATAELWRKGLGKWGQGPERLQRLADAADFVVYTPGSSAGMQLTVLRSFAAPPAEIAEDRELFADRIEGAVTGLLSMLGIDADPVQSRETILLSSILGHAWGQGEDLSIADLVRLVQEPPFKQLGVLDLETFFPAKERTSLALSLNGLIASPGFASWLEGEPLDVQRLLHAESGKPRVSVVSVAHMNDSERMFFVTVLLNEILGWMRQQSGTGSLRAVLYMDEIFGYFPPSGNPPSKKPMLTLLKQARAFGLGVVLATQNPVDLDYKGLANTGTWMIGRLQTERDKLRVLDGLEGALSSGGKSYDRAELDRLLSGLGKRVFLLHNVHEDRPVVFQTRWALNYLRGPLDRAGIERLMASRKAALAAARPEPAAAQAAGESARSAAPGARPARPTAVVESTRPALPAEVEQGFEAPGDDWDGESKLLYRPYFGCVARLHYVNASAGVDRWVSHTVRAPLVEDRDVPLYEEASLDDGERAHRTRKSPAAGADFEALPGAASRERSYKSWAKELEQFLYRTRPMTLWKHKPFRLVSEPGEPEGDFRARVAQAAREERDREIEKLRKRYDTKLERQRDALAKAEDKLELERDQLSSRRKDSWLAVGSNVLGAIFGKRKLKLGASASKAGKVDKEKADVQRAEDKLRDEREDLRELERELEAELELLAKPIAPADFELDDAIIHPRKSDIETDDLKLVWIPTPL